MVNRLMIPNGVSKLMIPSTKLKNAEAYFIVNNKIVPTDACGSVIFNLLIRIVEPVNNPPVSNVNMKNNCGLVNKIVLSIKNHFFL